MQTLKQVAKAHRFAVMQPAAVAERLALAAITTHDPEQIVLHPPRGRQMHYCYQSNFCLDLRSGLSSNTAWRREHQGIHAGYWTGTDELLCHRGTAWRHDFNAVVDDFGNLVEVQ